MCASASPVAVQEKAPAKAPPFSHARRVLSRNSVAIGVLSSASSEHMSQGNVWKKMNADRCGHFHDVGCIRRHQRKHRLAHVRGAFFPAAVSRSRFGVVRGGHSYCQRIASGDAIADGGVLVPCFFAAAAAKTNKPCSLFFSDRHTSRIAQRERVAPCCQVSLLAVRPSFPQGLLPWRRYSGTGCKHDYLRAKKS